MCTYVKKLYEFFEIPSKEDIICNTLSGKCLSVIGDCQSCGAAIKRVKYELTEHQQFEITKLLLSSLFWRDLAEFNTKESYEEGLAEAILEHWNSFPDHIKGDIIKNLLNNEKEI